MSFGTRELEQSVAAGAVEPHRVRIWARSAHAGPHTLRFEHDTGALVDEHAIMLDPSIADGTYADWFGGLSPSTRYRVQLRREDEVVSHAAFRTPPAGRDDAPRRWSFGAVSCHQPFDDDGSLSDVSVSMLRAARAALVRADVAFVLMMGDQTYADSPASHSLFDDEYFRRIAPRGRTHPLQCTREELRALYQARHRNFWGCEAFDRLVRQFSCYCMPDDHELVDNFGSDPSHAGEDWQALRNGALDAFFDYQGSRVHPRDPATGDRPAALDWGFRWGPAAVFGLDVRSNRRTEGERTTVFSEAQRASLQGFLHANVDAPLLVVMAPIPLVHVHEGVVAKIARVLGHGSDLHERWAHPQCHDAREQFVSLLLAQAQAAPRQRIVLLGGDVHAGAAFSIDFADEGAQLLQFTSSALSNQQGWLAEVASGQSVHTAEAITLGDGRTGNVSLLRGRSREHDHNPYGGLNAGIVDVFDHGDWVGVGFRLIGHDGEGNPVTRFDTGEIGLRRDPDRRLSGMDELADSLPPARR